MPGKNQPEIARRHAGSPPLVAQEQRPTSHRTAFARQCHNRNTKRETRDPKFSPASTFFVALAAARRHRVGMNCNLIVALDLETREEALAMLERIGPALKTVKIGLQLFTRYGPPLVEEISAMGYDIFLDLKLHDIPNTVAKAVQSLASLPVTMLTIHAGGGSEMMAAAHQARVAHRPELILLAVTVLTSMDGDALQEIGIAAAPEDQVCRLARLAASSGISGVVCSPLETGMVRDELGPDAVIVTPGVRPAEAAADEQKRILTPRQAAEAGASFIVVGRPVLRAASPAATVRAILEELR